MCQRFNKFRKTIQKQHCFKPGKEYDPEMGEHYDLRKYFKVIWKGLPIHIKKGSSALVAGATTRKKELAELSRGEAKQRAMAQLGKKY